MKKFLIIGAGNLGERSIQSIQEEFHDPQIFISEKNKDREAYIKNKYGVKSYIENTSLQDFAFIHISTTSTDRHNIILNLEVRKGCFVLIEKPTASSLSQLIDQTKMKLNRSYFVNLPRRVYPINSFLKTQIKGPFQMSLKYKNLNLFSNISHFIDLSRYFGANGKYSIDAGNLKKIDTPREGYVDYCGDLVLRFECGSVLNFEDSTNQKNSIININTNDFSIEYDETSLNLMKVEGLCQTIDFDRINIAPYHSQLLGSLLRKFEEDKVSDFPNLQDVARDNLEIYRFLHNYTGLDKGKSLSIS